MADKINDLDISSIKSVKDEHSYWSSLAIRYDLKSEIIDRAAMFAEQLQPLAQKYSHIRDKPMQDILDILANLLYLVYYCRCN